MPLLPCNMTTCKVSSGKLITEDEWVNKLNCVTVRKEDMNKIIMNFLITEGYADAALKFEKESGTKCIHLQSTRDREALCRDIQIGNVADTIENVKNLNPKMLEMNPQLQFHLQQQRLIEKIRDGKHMEAIEFTQKEIEPLLKNNHTFIEELERTLSLLAFEDPSSSPNGDLMGNFQRLKTARELNVAILVSQNREKDPKLAHVLKMLIWTQQQLDKKICYPLIMDIEKAALREPHLAGTDITGSLHHSTSLPYDE